MRVLVIDDEPDVLMLCRMNLEFAGHEVLEASSGEAGLEMALAERPDVVVLDVMLPRRDGLAVLGDLSSEASTKNVPVIMLTAKTNRDEKRAAWRAGWSECVTTPFSPIELVGLVDRTHRMSRRERSARRKQALNSLSD